MVAPFLYSTNSLYQNCDLIASFLFGGKSIPKERGIDGKDFLPLIAFFNRELDLQKGIEIQYEEFISSAYYDSTVGGSTYELGIEARVGEKTAYILIELVKNENGFGIYNFQLKPNKIRGFAADSLS